MPQVVWRKAVQAQDRLVDFCARFGAKPLGHNRKLVFSDFTYTEMVLELEPDPRAITMDPALLRIASQRRGCAPT